MSGTPIAGRAAVVGAGMTELTRESGRSVLSQAREAALAALDAAGLPASSVDGVIEFSMYDDSVPAEALGAAIGAGELSFVLDFAQGGQSASYMVGLAAMAVEAGMASTIVVYRALNGRSGVRIGRNLARGGGTEFRYPLGFVAYSQYTAMWARRYLIETGATEEDFGWLAISARTWAERNERAVLRRTLSLDEYFASPYVASPYRIVDCTTEVDGAAAVVVTSLERARDLKLPPAVIRSAAWATSGFDLDMGSTLRYPDFTRGYAALLADRLWRNAGVGPADVDVAQLYDCFTGVLAANLEGLGLCERGEAGALAKAGQLGPGGRLPVNTNGGLLAEGYLHGMNTITEAVWQLQGRGGARQVADVGVVLTCSGGLGSGSALILTSDR